MFYICEEKNKQFRSEQDLKQMRQAFENKTQKKRVKRSLHLSHWELTPQAGQSKGDRREGNATTFASSHCFCARGAFRKLVTAALSQRSSTNAAAWLQFAAFL